MRKMPARFLARRRIRLGLAIGGALAAGIAVWAWNQGWGEDYTTASLLDSTDSIPQPDSLRLETPSGASDRADRHDDSAIVQTRYEARFSQEYFEPGYYAAASPGRVSAPASSSTAPWLGDLDDLHKIALSAASPPAIDFSRSDKVSVFVPGSVVALAPPPPVSRLANPGPFHLFVTSENVSPTSAVESTVPSPGFSAVPSAGVPGVSSIGETAGTLLRKR
jgi:hypothetical protein